MLKYNIDSDFLKEIEYGMSNVKSCPNNACDYIFWENTQNSDMVKQHINSHLVESKFIKATDEGNDKDVRQYSITEIMNKTQESNSYLFKEILKIIKEPNKSVKNREIKNLDQELKLIEQKNKDAIKILTEAQEENETSEENIVPVPNLINHYETKIESKELKHLPNFSPNAAINKDATALKLIQFLKKIYGYIQQKKYKEEQCILIILEKLQDPNGRNPALEFTEMFIENYEQRYQKLPKFKDITKNLEEKYCSEMQPMIAMKNLYKIDKKEREENDQFAHRINILTKRAAITLSNADEKTRNIWQERTSLDIFLSKIKSHERDIILKMNRTRKIFGQRHLNLYEAVKELEIQKEKKELYEDKEQKNTPFNFIKQNKIETNEGKVHNPIRILGNNRKKWRARWKEINSTPDSNELPVSKDGTWLTKDYDNLEKPEKLEKQENHHQ